MAIKVIVELQARPDKREELAVPFMATVVRQLSSGTHDEMEAKLWPIPDLSRSRR